MIKLLNIINLAIQVFIAYLFTNCNWNEFKNNIKSKNTSFDTDIIESTHGICGWLKRTKRFIGDITLKCINLGKKNHILSIWKDLKTYYPKTADLIYNLVINEDYKGRYKRYKKQQTETDQLAFKYVRDKFVDKQKKMEAKEAKKNNNNNNNNNNDNNKNKNKNKQKKTKLGRKIDAEEKKKQKQYEREKKAAKKKKKKEKKKSKKRVNVLDSFDIEGAVEGLLELKGSRDGKDLNIIHIIDDKEESENKGIGDDVDDEDNEENVIRNIVFDDDESNDEYDDDTEDEDDDDTDRESSGGSFINLSHVKDDDDHIEKNKEKKYKYYCPDCGKGYIRKKCYETHIKQKHGMNDDDDLKEPQRKKRRLNDKEEAD